MVVCNRGLVYCPSSRGCNSEGHGAELILTSALQSGKATEEPTRGCVIGMIKRHRNDRNTVDIDATVDLHF